MSKVYRDSEGLAGKCDKCGRLTHYLVEAGGPLGKGGFYSWRCAICRNPEKVANLLAGMINRTGERGLTT